VRDLRIDHDGVTLAASYSPAGDTAIVALHGAGEGTRDGLLYENLHEVLPPAGIGVVTFDRRGEGESTGDASRGRFTVQVRDALAVLEAVADTWSPVAPSVEAWRQARGEDVEIVVIPDAEHELTLPDGTLAPEYERTLVDWLVRRAGS
jgi:alpha-beta hydrolase superfamily lysophospholipase